MVTHKVKVKAITSNPVSVSKELYLALPQGLLSNNGLKLNTSAAQKWPPYLTLATSNLSLISLWNWPLHLALLWSKLS